MITISVTNAAWVWDVDPVAFRIGDAEYRYYSLCFVALLLTIFFCMRWVYRREGEPVERAAKFMLGAVVGILAGARLGHVFFYNWPYYRDAPLKIVEFWNGGLSSHGATFAVLLVCLANAHARRTPFRVTLDRIPFIAPLGAWVRLGNFFNGEIVGQPTDVPWAVVFPNHSALPRHPSQLYEVLLNLSVFAAVLWIDRAYRRRGVERPLGLLFGIYCILYFGGRFLLEFLKEYQTLESGLRMGQWLSIPMVLLGVGMVVAAQWGPWRHQHAKHYLREAGLIDRDEETPDRRS